MRPIPRFFSGKRAIAFVYASALTLPLPGPVHHGNFPSRIPGGPNAAMPSRAHPGGGGRRVDACTVSPDDRHRRGSDDRCRVRRRDALGRRDARRGPVGAGERCHGGGRVAPALMGHPYAVARSPAGGPGDDVGDVTSRPLAAPGQGAGQPTLPRCAAPFRSPRRHLASAAGRVRTLGPVWKRFRRLGRGAAFEASFRARRPATTAGSKPSSATDPAPRRGR